MKRKTNRASERLFLLCEPKDQDEKDDPCENDADIVHAFYLGGQENGEAKDERVKCNPSARESIDEHAKLPKLEAS